MGRRNWVSWDRWEETDLKPTNPNLQGPENNLVKKVVELWREIVFNPEK